MKYKIVFFICFFNCCVNAQNGHDENITRLVQRYTASLNLKCEILMQADVEGMHIPDKMIAVEFKNDEKPKVIGEGLALLPKKGMVNQFRKLLSSPMQAIFLSKRNNNLVYKLVALDPNSDWITADLIFDEESLLIYESVITTRKYGAFKTINDYKDKIYPSKSVITFSIKKFKIPLKFIGRSLKVPDQPESKKEVMGKITLNYTYL